MKSIAKKLPQTQAENVKSKEGVIAYLHISNCVIIGYFVAACEAVVKPPLLREAGRLGGTPRPTAGGSQLVGNVAKLGMA